MTVFVAIHRTHDSTGILGIFSTEEAAWDRLCRDDCVDPSYAAYVVERFELDVEVDE